MTMSQPQDSASTHAAAPPGCWGRGFASQNVFGHFVPCDTFVAFGIASKLALHSLLLRVTEPKGRGVFGRFAPYNTFVLARAESKLSVLLLLGVARSDTPALAGGDCLSEQAR